MGPNKFNKEVNMRGQKLRNIPDDVFKILLIEQAKEKIAKKKGQFGIEQTIYKIVRDYERCKKDEEIRTK